jgi:hypothetical protein
MMIELIIGVLAMAGQLRPSPSGDVNAGIAAYERGDHDDAFRLLKPFVYDPAVLQDTRGDPWALVYLGHMYERGQGVERDRALGCAMLLIARVEFDIKLEWDHAAALDVDVASCQVDAARLQIYELMAGNFFDGVVRTVIDLGSGAFVIVDRASVQVDTVGGRGETFVPVLAGEVALPVRHTAISLVDAGAVRVRHFLEFFVWTTSICEGRVRRSLEWRPLEIVGTDFRHGTFVTILDVWDMPYPSPEAGLAYRDRVGLRATADGSVAWAIRGTDLSGVFRDR